MTNSAYGSPISRWKALTYWRFHLHDGLAWTTPFFILVVALDMVCWYNPDMRWTGIQLGIGPFLYWRRLTVGMEFPCRTWVYRTRTLWEEIHRVKDIKHGG